MFRWLEGSSCRSKTRGAEVYRSETGDQGFPIRLRRARANPARAMRGQPEGGGIRDHSCVKQNVASLGPAARKIVKQPQAQSERACRASRKNQGGFRIAPGPPWLGLGSSGEPPSAGTRTLFEWWDGKDREPIDRIALQALDQIVKGSPSEPKVCQPSPDGARRLLGRFRDHWLNLIVLEVLRIYPQLRVSLTR